MLTKFTSQSTKLAAKALADGLLVSFPTETVYGLGADATNDKAVARIYEAKGRPSFNPLIAHVCDVTQAQEIGQFTDIAYQLAHHFWPGALSLVVSLQPECRISKLVTAGLDTIALRLPAPYKVRQLIKEAGVPVAAPSANRSGRISPTLASHVVQDLGDGCAFILDDGACEAGLESTIIDCTGKQAVILRPGPVTAEMIRSACPDIEVNDVFMVNDEAPNAPGQLTSHYAPSKPVRLHVTRPERDEIYIGFGKMDVASDFNLSPSGDLIEAAANLFAMLHEADKTQRKRIAIAPIRRDGIGAAIHDRLMRAAADSLLPRDDNL
ncbi:MAG: L-threonylcarbamoyladenylate synthase [Candidatus Puniceispirillaceae bacterium]